MKNAAHEIFAKILLVSFITILFCNSLYAQKKTFSGYYIGKNGDSVIGTFPHYSQWVKNPSTVSFIPSASVTPVELIPDNTIRFTIENYDSYLSYTGQRLTNPIDYTQAISNEDTVGFKDQLATVSTFLRLVGRTGNFDLFVLNDNIRTNYFYKLGNAPLQELKFKTYYQAGRVNELHEYRQQLSNLFSKEMEKRQLLIDLEKVKYTEESLIGLLESLTPVEKRRKRIKNPAAGLVVAGGVSANFVKVTGERTTQTETDYNTSVSPVISIGFMSPLNRSFGRFFVYPQLTLFNFESEGDLIVGSTKTTTTYKASLAASPAINVGVNLVNKDQFKYFASAGAGMMFLLKNLQVDKSAPADNTGLAQSSQIELTKLTFNAHLSSGVMVNNRVLVSATYNVPVPIGNFLYYTPYLSSMQLTVGYKL